MKERLKKYFSSFSVKPVDFIIDENYNWKAVYDDGKVLPSFCFSMTIKQAMYIVTGEQNDIFLQ